MNNKTTELTKEEQETIDKLKEETTAVPHSLIPLKDDRWGIRIDDGPYTGVIYAYDTISFKEVENEHAVLSFDYTIFEDMGFGDDLRSEDFTNCIGDILTLIIVTNLEKENNKEIDDETDDDNQDD